MWIEIRTRLPALNGHYLVFNGQDIDIAWFQAKNTGTLEFSSVNSFYDEYNQRIDITHWMSLPEPPKIFK